jgi:isopenicillin-N epimerase
VRAHNHALAWHGAHALAAAVGTRFEVAESMVGCMATLPLPAAFGTTAADAELLRDTLLFEDGIEVPVLAFKDRLWLRLSVQAYNDESDIAKLADALAARLAR